MMGLGQERHSRIDWLMLLGVAGLMAVGLAFIYSATMVNEASGQMKSLMERNSDQILLIFIIFAVGFMILTLPIGFIAGWAAKRFAVIR